MSVPAKHREVYNDGMDHLSAIVRLIVNSGEG